MSALGFGPSLALRRGSAAVASVFDFTGGALPPGASLSRASGGTRVNAAGLLVSEGADVARFDFSGGALLGLLVEGARSNAFTFAEQFDNAAWTIGSATLTPNDRVAPDGVASADRLVLASNGVLQRASIGAGGLTMTVSLFLYATAPVSGLQFGFFDNVAGGQYAGVTLPGGVWTRAALTRTFGAGATDRRMQLLGPSGGTTIWVWGGQGEAAASPGSYIATVGTVGARAADVLTLALGVADGTAAVRVTFDDLTTQDVGLSASGGSAVVPAATLNRPRVRRIERV